MAGSSLSFNLSNLRCNLAVLFCFICSCGVVMFSEADANYLTLDYYAKTCPKASEIIHSQMESAVSSDPQVGPRLLRMHFHDCFVQGCDGSVLLDDTETFKGEKTAGPNINSLHGFDVVDKIKSHLESECPGVVSCADLLALAAKDAVILAGGPYWDVPLGRKDSRSASLEKANTDIPLPNQGLITLISKFLAKGLSTTDMVALSGSHTIGVARCTSFRDRIYGDYQYTSKDGGELLRLKKMCPEKKNDENTTNLDHTTPTLFDNAYYGNLVKGEGLLNSDQELYSSIIGFQTVKLVKKYAEDSLIFFKHYSDSMVRMGNITNPHGGEVRNNCRVMN